MILDYHRGHRAFQFPSVTLLRPLKANFQPNPNVNIGFYKNPTAPKLLDPLKSVQEVQGVQHIKFAVFDDHVILTGANLSENYFTEREDRYVIFKNNPELANFCDDLGSTLLDCSFQMNDEGILEFPSNYHNISKLVSPSVKNKFKSMMKDRVKMLKFIHKDYRPEFQVPKPEKSSVETESSLVEYEPRNQGVQKLKKALKPDQIFNILKDMPNELNIVTGEGGWSDSLTKQGKDVYLFPTLQFEQAHCRDDLELFTELLKTIENVSIASGYMGFPSQTVSILKQKKTLELLCASPLANGFLGDGAKNWIPYLYRAVEHNLFKKVPQAHLAEYEREGWTFHGKGIWASDSSGAYLSSIGSSNFSYRSYFRDVEFQVYMWTRCPEFKRTMLEDKQRLWAFSKSVTAETFKTTEFKYKFPTKILSRLLRSFL